jgi:16S rRNA (uracil1498-N3)-methyltransferase
MGKFHIRPDAIDGERVRFDAEEARHLSRVLRLSPGAVIQAIDGTGMEYTVRMEEISPKAGVGTILLRAPALTESPLALTLAQGVPKGDKMEWIVEKATELGVNRIIPLLTERVVIRLDPGRWRERARRWQRVAKESAKQAGRGKIPVVEAPVPFADFSFRKEEIDLALCFWEGERRGLRALLERRDIPPRSALLVVGPEGGLSLPEVEALRAKGCPSVGLGPRILRTESAGLVGLSLLQYLYGDLGASSPGL